MSRHTASPMTTLARTLAALVATIAAATVVSAQTVIVKDAPAGGTVDIVVNNTVVASDTANANGRLTLVVPGANRADMDALIAVDSCGTRRRIVFTQPSVTAAAPDAACLRREIAGLFVVRPVSTIVFNVEGPHPRLLLRQGPFNPDAPPKTWAAVPGGLMISGSTGFGTFGNVGLVQCGNLTDCAADDTGFSLGAGAEFWFARYFAVEVGYLKPVVANWEGAGTGFSFSGEQDVRLFTAGAKVGLPTGPVRVFARGGVNKHRGLSTLSQKIDDTTITVDAVTTTITGGTQQIQLETEGYGYYVGAGLELWLNRHVAPFFGADYQKIKGSDRSDGEGLMDDRHISVTLGIRLRLGK